MSIATWPTVLPRPTRSDWQAQWDDPRQRRSAGGPPGYRRRYSATAKSVSLRIDVPRADKTVFDIFYEKTTRMGSLPFWMPDPTTDGWPLLTADGDPVVDATGAPLLLSARWLCLFGAEPPVETMRGVRFQFAFSVSVMP
ncbi:hypothetical protein T8T21_00675 [Limimaricola variabilis]|uniref:hypothetical protein n=1 Tax=Limimaricola variabilis TaxID=1492771 RepID=UPI002AC9C97E|nr:hypothetical protein [Limimaricola variabilis]WPY94673.1 hypothetical protein T8T21_00675 [Limimaricola variabilis]